MNDSNSAKLIYFLTRVKKAQVIEKIEMALLRRQSIFVRLSYDYVYISCSVLPERERWQEKAIVRNV